MLEMRENIFVLHLQLKKISQNKHLVQDCFGLTRMFISTTPTPHLNCRVKADIAKLKPSKLQRPWIIVLIQSQNHILIQSIIFSLKIVCSLHSILVHFDTLEIWEINLSKLIFQHPWSFGDMTVIDCPHSNSITAYGILCIKGVWCNLSIHRLQLFKDCL